MGSILIKLFIKNPDKTDDPDVREQYGKFAGVVGIVSNLLLCLMKVALGLLSRSIAIIADGINNLADASSSIITLVGFKLAAQPEDYRCILPGTVRYALHFHPVQIPVLQGRLPAVLLHISWLLSYLILSFID